MLSKLIRIVLAGVTILSVGGCPNSENPADKTSGETYRFDATEIVETEYAVYRFLSEEKRAVYSELFPRFQTLQQRLVWHSESYTCVVIPGVFGIGELT